MSFTLSGIFRPYNARLIKNEIAAAHAGIEMAFIAHELGSESDDFMRNCHPLGRTPVLETPEGYLFESTAILRYIARIAKDKQLYGRSAYEAACCDQWIEFAAGEIDAIVFSMVPVRLQDPNADVSEKEKELARTLDSLEAWLETRTFLVGERLTIADIAVATALMAVVRFTSLGELLPKQYKSCWRLYNTVMQQPETAAALQRAGTSWLPSATPKEEKPKEEKAKAEKPKAEKPKAANDDDDDEDLAPKEVKKANPLDALPPSPFVLDAFKREYSNNDVRTIAAPYFFKNFDPEGYSCFWCKYKYNDENKMQFMTANLIRGWFQRMEPARKYAFGVALITGEEKNHEISGFWVFRGKGIPQIVLDVEDTELFTWTPIPNINSETAAITDYLCWEGPTIPRPVLEGRTFK